VSLEVAVREIGTGVTLVEPEGEFEVYTAPQVSDALEELTSSEGCRVCISLARVTFLDSKGIGVIVAGTKRARRHGGELAVICASERFARHFQILKLDEYLTIVDSEQSALDRLAPPEAGNGPE